MPIIKTIQWNIGGGKTRDEDSDPTDQLSYIVDSLDSIVETLAKYEPDVVTLQECHSDEESDQVERIAKGIGLEYYVSDVYDDSHLEKGKKLTQGIISRFSLSDHRFEYFLNPKLETTGPLGEKWLSHDKGVTACMADIGGRIVNVKTSHSLPFRKFHIDPLSQECAALREDMAQKLSPEQEKFLFQGDLNYDKTSMGDFLSEIFVSGVSEVLLDSATTPKGRRYDHVLYRGLSYRKSFVDMDVLTDHYPVISEFEI